ncbi:outer membrane protein assembly factor BamD [Candidatus Omnitrophota bacterium]
MSNVTDRRFKYTAFLVLAAAIIFTECCHAYWVWTPGSKKFINPKYAVKDTPEEQFAWAMGFYNAADYKKAVAEFEKLIKNYEFSEFAAKAQYYLGLSYEKLEKYYYAYQSYQKIVENYPYSENLDDAILREFEIANYYLNRKNPKFLGSDIMAPLGRAIEIFQKVVENAPYGEYADQAQYNLGHAFKKAERYDEAVQAYRKFLDEYPSSPLLDEARYQLALCAYKASLSPAYDQEPVDKAIKAFEEFIDDASDPDLVEEADITLQRLKDRAAQKAFEIAKFYEKQKKYTSAVTYYQDVVDNYPDSFFAFISAERMSRLKRKIGER